MPPLAKYRKMKRPKVVAKKNLKRRSYDKKLSALIYEKLKTNNKALARALTQQKEETQLLTQDNFDLSRQLQEINYRQKRHIDLISGILKNSREAMNNMVKATEQVVFAISACNTFLQPEGSNTSRPSISSESNRRGSTKSPNKSPARGVVQPMVSGHAIAQPAISLSRLRIAMPPSVSDIEETAESSPGTPGNRTAQRLANRPTRPVNRLAAPLIPQRIRVSSPRVDESLCDDRRLSNISSRRSSRYQKRKSRNSGRHSGDHEPSRNSINLIETSIRSPRVSLEDVSRLMHNSHSINVRNLMDISTEEPSNSIQDTSEGAGASQTHHFTSPPAPAAAVPPQVSPVTPSPTSSPVSPTSSPTFQFDHRARKIRKRKMAEKAKAVKDQDKRQFARVNQGIYEDDPLEGTSWRFSNGTGASDISSDISSSLPVNGHAGTINESNNQTIDDANNRTNDEILERSRLRVFNAAVNPCQHIPMLINPDNSWNGSDDDDDEGQKCQMIKLPRQTNRDEETTNFTNDFLRNVCTSRGRVGELDPDDFTMMRRPDQPYKAWTMDDMEIPDIPPQVLEAPLVRPAEVMVEPEITSTIQIMAGLAQQMNQAIGGDGLPNVTINTSVTMPVIDTAGRESDDDTTIIVPGRRNRGAVPIAESSSESESSSPPKRIVKGRARVKGSKRKDPSSVKVVLEKLKDLGERKRPGSPDPRRSTLNGYANRPSNSLTSDSESSNASFGSNGRPRRQKAPVNFAEPSLRKKLRRE